MATKQNKPSAEVTSTTEEYRAASATLDKVARKYVAGWERTENTRGTLQFEAAQVTLVYLQNGWLGTKGAPGVMIGAGDYAAKFGKSATWVTQIKRLARAVEKGITPTDTPDLWKRLAQRNGWSQDGIKQALDSSTTTVEDVENAVVEKDAAPKAKAKKAAKPKATPAEPKRITPGNAREAVETLHATVAGMLGNLSGETLLALEESADGFLTAIREELAKTQTKQGERVAS